MSSDSYFIRNFWFGMSGGVTSDKMSDKQGYTSKHSIYIHTPQNTSQNTSDIWNICSFTFLFIIIIIITFSFFAAGYFRQKCRVGGWVKSLTGLWILCSGLKLGMKVITAEQLSQEHVSYNLPSLVLRFVDQIRSLCILNS